MPKFKVYYEIRLRGDVEVEAEDADGAQYEVEEGGDFTVADLCEECQDYEIEVVEVDDIDEDEEE